MEDDGLDMWDKIVKLGCGSLAFSFSELLEMTLRELSLAKIGQEDKHEMDMRLAWEVSRWQTAVGLAPHSKRKITPRSLISFPWERTQKRVALDRNVNRMKWDKRFPEKL